MIPQTLKVTLSHKHYYMPILILTLTLSFIQPLLTPIIGNIMTLKIIGAITITIRATHYLRRTMVTHTLLHRCHRRHKYFHENQLPDSKVQKL